MSFKKVVYLDLETTGIDTKKDEILSIGIIAVNQGKIMYKHNIYCDHNIDIPEESFKIHKLSKKFLKENGFDPKKVLEKVYKIIEGADLVVAYNAVFDLDFLHNSFLKILKKPLVLKNVLCPLTIYRDHYKYPHKLVNACQKLDISLENAHNSLDDIMATKDVLFKLSKLLDINKYVNHLGYLEKYPVSKKYSWDININYFPQRFNGDQYILKGEY